MTSSRRVVYEVFEEGSSTRIPLHIESDNKDEEYALGDIVGVGAKYSEWREFYRKGGPYARKPGERLRFWIERVSAGEYQWPELSDFVSKSIESFEEKARKYARERFIIFKILGPTETAESFFAPKPSESLLKVGQIAHSYGFAVCLKLKRQLAVKIYDKICNYILETIKAGAEIDYVDAVRIADDMAGYTGPLYPTNFIREKYIEWHRKFVEAIKKRCKYAILHCDGDLTREKLITLLSEVYDGLHPLDLCPKSTVKAAEKWVEKVAEARLMVGREIVFFTGVPVDLVFNRLVEVEEFVKIPMKLVNLLKGRHLILATTHSPYPGRGFHERLPLEKIIALRKKLLKLVS